MNQTATRPIVVTDGDFADKVLRSEKPVLVDFWAEWCAPCRALGPIIESLADDFADRVTIAKVDIDANQEAAMRYGIRSIPTVVLFDKGQVVDTFIGVRPKADYIASLQNALS
ncbi:thioredoxin [Gammaproteobacteria bacterium]|jgi:thioredoxin 1|nr:thioredoxin [Gammaproteobacteria bacterium]